MSPVTPRLPLALLLVAGACLLGGGVALSRREHEVRIAGDRGPLRAFAAGLQRELLRLEALHERHLFELTTRLTLGDALGTQQECDSIVGVVECTFLPRNAARAEENVRLPRIPAGAYARATFVTPVLERKDLRVLDQARFFGSDAPAQGWLEESGWPLMYWDAATRPVLKVITVEPREVQASMNRWILSWLESQPGRRMLSEGSAQLITPEGSVLLPPQKSAAAAPHDAPHWSQALPTRYGSWHLASWDRVETHRTHHAPTLAISSAAALMVVLLGVFVFQQQRRASRQAAQRVSFVNRVSHELRTPLTNMLLNLDVVEESLSASDARVRGRLALVREEAARLARLIANVLTFSRAESGAAPVQATVCRPREVVDSVLAQFATGFARRDISVTRSHLGDDAPSGVDADALAQITGNLLSNVEKYAPGVPVQVRTLQQEGRLKLAVSDDGPGIPAGDAERVFTPFVRLDDRVTAGVTGTGLGLSIARELAERLGGTLRLESAERGACFVLDIPLATVADSGAGPGKSSSIPNPAPRGHSADVSS